MSVEEPGFKGELYNKLGASRYKRKRAKFGEFGGKWFKVHSHAVSDVGRFRKTGQRAEISHQRNIKTRAS